MSWNTLINSKKIKKFTVDDVDVFFRKPSIRSMFDIQRHFEGLAQSLPEEALQGEIEIDQLEDPDHLLTGFALAIKVTACTEDRRMIFADDTPTTIIEKLDENLLDLGLIALKMMGIGNSSKKKSTSSSDGLQHRKKVSGSSKSRKGREKRSRKSRS